MRKLSRKEVIKRGPKKGKSKGNLKGKIKFKKKLSNEATNRTLDIPHPKPPTNTLDFHIHIGKELLENIRKIVRKELDKPITIIYKDFVETRNASSEIIDSVEKVKTKNSFVLVPKKKS